MKDLKNMHNFIESEVKRVEKIRRFICTTNQLERLMKDILIRAKVIEVFVLSRFIFARWYIVYCWRWKRDIGV